MASRPFQFREKKHFKIGKSAAKHFEGLAALSIHSAERRVAVKAGCKPVHFSLDGCPLSCYFSESVATTSGHFVHKSERRTKNGAFIYALSAVENRPALAAPRHTSTALFSCRFKCPCLPGGNGIFTATPTERITHYTLLRKVVCQMGALPPLETPTRKGGTLPLHGAHTAFSCYPALRLYRLSKSQRGIDVVSLTK